MKIFRIVFALSMGVMGGMLMAQTEADFPNWMKQVQKSSKGVTTALKGGDLKAAQDEATTLASTFKTVEAFFSKNKMDDAATRAKAAGDAATAVAKAANIDAANSAAPGATGSCQGCH